MSKSMFNVVNPDYVIEMYGADTLRMYEMFLGPIEVSKPWDTNGIDGVSRFLKKAWNLYDNIREGEETSEEKKIIHRLIKKISEDMENFSFNTSVSAFMIAVNELGKCESRSRSTLRIFSILLSPFAPHLSEEMWECSKNKDDVDSVLNARWPEFDEKYIRDDTFTCPIQINGKVRTTLTLQKGMTDVAVREMVLSNLIIQQHLCGKDIKKFIIVPDKIVNIVV